MAPLPSPNLRLGVRALAGLPGVEIVEQPIYDETVSRWVLRLRLSIGATSEFVPAVTDWYVLIESTYPAGLAEFHPAEDGGIHATFKHMRRNLPTDRAWRTGVPCLDRPGRWLGNNALSGQPNDAAGKLRFFTEAALRWLDFAARDALTVAGERFELPPYAEKRASEAIGFDESPDRLQLWSTLFNRAGNAVGRKLNIVTAVIDHFRLREVVVHPSHWGTYISSLTALTNLSWITLPRMPIIAPWAPPRTWGEFRLVTQAMGINLDELLKLVYHRVRRGGENDRRIVLVGFPIPDVYDGPDIQMHWQPLSLPEAIGRGLELHTDVTDKLNWNLQRARRLADDTEIEWFRSENWSEESLSIRGALDERLRTPRIALVGAGALGSAVAELLVREGCRSVDIFEHDWMEVGNLRRHTLTLNDVGKAKSVVLAERLNAVSPFAKMRGFDGIWEGSENLDQLREAYIVIDCTANEDVISSLEHILNDGKERWFFSGAFGLDADRLFLYGQHGVGVDGAFYLAQMAGPLAEERKKIDERGINGMQNAGCWNPVFPGKWSAIQLRASDMLNAIEMAVKSEDTEARFLSIIPPAV